MEKGYISLDDLQSIWSVKMKPYILGIFDSMEMDEDTGDISVTYDDGIKDEGGEES